MRVLVAMMKHETNTFSPVPTDWARFEAWSGYLGADALRAYAGTDALRCLSHAMHARGHDVVTPIAAEAMPSGKVSVKLVMVGKILEAVQDGVDAALLDLHGAMVSEATDDGEGTLLQRMREVAPDLPIGVTYDLHTNLTEKMVGNATCLIGYKTYPHVDMHAVGTQIGNILLDVTEGNRAAPVMAWGQPPLLSQTLRMGMTSR